ncbi:MAG: oxygen-independent coproporphyrinogen III oxidase [Verrucomicrobiota bacterium]|nr:oxygen-independent coproporphyrinogen III oxidase [Verrucomicrobiota bacterium]
MRLMINVEKLLQFDCAVPRYTSYPPATQFTAIDPSLFAAQAEKFQKSARPLSLYLHIPFCRSMCLFCACSVTLNRDAARQSHYVEHLLREIALVSAHLGPRRSVMQLHFGGGTPTQLTDEELSRIMQELRSRFLIASDAEISIEVDPRTALDGKLVHLKKLGFSRISFGVQDLDPKVQEAVRRRQTEEMTVQTYLQARELGFSGVNVDLIYGLPFQTIESFQRTAERLSELRPDRIALYSYAKVPWLKPHQRAIPDSALPSSREKMGIYLAARKIFCEAGYVQIGMDHFALPGDSLAKGYLEKRLTRNFQGYSLALAQDMLGFGCTAIGFLENAYFQNEKELLLYEARVAEGKLPFARGFVLGEEDLLRRFVIQSLMCDFVLDKKIFAKRFQKEFDAHFHFLQPRLEFFQNEGLIEMTESELRATPMGSLLIRLVSSLFDSYTTSGGSRVI